MKEPVKSLAEQAYLAIKRDLLRCELDPGSQIAQSQLMERFNFGVTPIREALKRLEHEGYVTAVPRFGYIIAPITFNDIYNNFELRSYLEQLSVQLAIQRAPDEVLHKIQEKAGFTYHYGDQQSYQDFLDQNLDFHYQIALSTGNKRLAEMVSVILEEMERIFHLGLELRDSAGEMRDEHLALASALISRDEKQAIEVLNSQLQHSRQRIIDMLDRKLINRSINELSIQ